MALFSAFLLDGTGVPDRLLCRQRQSAQWRYRLKRAILILAAALFVQPAAAQTQCVAKDTSARILASASPNDVHPDWTGGSYVGLSWTFEVSGTEDTDTGTYLIGDLYAPNGGLVTSGAYVLADEWECGQ